MPGKILKKAIEPIILSHILIYNKMKALKLIAIMSFAGIMMFSCSKSGRKALEKGDYFTAALQAIERLKKDGDNSKAAEVLPNAYDLAEKDLLRDIDRANAANQQFRYERVVDGYSKLNELHDKIERCYACRKIVSPTSYFREYNEALEKAAAERYAYADNLLSKGTIDAGRAAFNNFEDLLKFAPNYKDAREKLEEALFMGSYHVVVEQPKINSKMYQYSNEFFQGKIDEFLQTNWRLNKFIRFYQPNEAKQLKIKPDHIVRLEFIEFVVGETHMKTEKANVTSKDSVKTGTAKINGQSVDVYGKVNATINRNIKSVISRGLLSMEIYDYRTNKTLLREQLPGEFVWTNKWSSFNGDERALTKEELNESRMKEELPPPPQQLFIEFCKPIYDQFTSRVKRFYDKY